jgi:hypothetical protein
MTSKWRLVGHEELYDIKTDPGQKNNVIDTYPEIAEKLRIENEVWWKEAETYFNDPCHITVGAPEENPTTICCMDVMGDVVWQQPKVVQAQKCTGNWNIEIAEPGSYTFSLRRWPEELPLAIDGMVSKDSVGKMAYGQKNGKRKILSPDKAFLKIQDKEYIQDVISEHESVDFKLEIKDAGKTKMEAWFFKDGDKLTSAYYIRVNREIS